MRLSLLVLAVFAMVAYASLGGAAAPDESTPDENLRQLMRERYEAAAKEMIARIEIFPTGRMPLSDTCDSIQRFSNAGLEVARTPSYRLKVCERAFESAKKIEDAVKVKFETDAETVESMSLASYTRLDMEIKLQKARQAHAAHETRAKLNDGDLPPLSPTPARHAET
jgi:hypothetical protein